MLTWQREPSARLGLSEWVYLSGLAYVLWRPVSHGSVLYPVLAATALASIFIIIREGLGPPIWLLGAWITLTSSVVLSSFVGSTRNTPGLNQQMAQWLGSLVVWGLFAWAMTPRLAKAAMHVTLWTIGVSSAVMLAFIASRAGFPAVVPQAILNQQGAGGSEQAGDLSIRWFGLSTLAAGAPLAVTAALLRPDAWLPSRRVTIPIAFVATVAAALAGRRAILIVAFIAPLVAWLMKRLAQRSASAESTKISTPLALGFIASPIVLAAGLASEVGRTFRSAVGDGIATYFGTADPATMGTDDAARVSQAHELISAWLESPLIGQGLGASLSGFERSDDRPWQFELQYHQLAMYSGLIGLIALVIASACYLRHLIRSLRLRSEYSSSLLATAVGAACLMVANGTNPYLQAVGHGWGIALPVAVLCARERFHAGSPSSLQRMPPTRDLVR